MGLEQGWVREVFAASACGSQQRRNSRRHSRRLSQKMRRHFRNNLQSYIESMASSLPSLNISLDMDSVQEFCRKWHIVEVRLFGSVLRDDFTGDSDIDFLVTFAEGDEPTLHELTKAKGELSGIIGRTADLLPKDSLESQLTRQAVREKILSEAKAIL